MDYYCTVDCIVVEDMIIPSCCMCLCFLCATVDNNPAGILTDSSNIVRDVVSFVG